MSETEIGYRLYEYVNKEKSLLLKFLNNNLEITQKAKENIHVIKVIHFFKILKEYFGIDLKPPRPIKNGRSFISNFFPFITCPATKKVGLEKFTKKLIKTK